MVSRLHQKSWEALKVFYECGSPCNEILRNPSQKEMMSLKLYVQETNIQSQNAIQN